MSAVGVVLLAFLLGGMLGGRILGRLLGVDLTAQGSGNVGATNALRSVGKGFGLAVLLIDASKGALAAVALPLLLPGASLLPLACGAAAVLGHCFSPFYKFNGGKGVATLAGVFLALMPKVFLLMLLVFMLVVLLTGVVSLATLAATATALIQVAIGQASLFSPPVLFTAVMAALVLFTHRQNWLRVWQGTEPRFEKARLLGRALGRP